MKDRLLHGSAIITKNEWSQLCGANLGCFKKNKKTKTDLLIFPLVFPEPSRNVLHQIVNKRVDVHLLEHSSVTARSSGGYLPHLYFSQAADSLWTPAGPYTSSGFPMGSSRVGTLMLDRTDRIGGFFWRS